PALLEIDEPFLGKLVHVRLGAEADRTGGTGLDAGGLEPHRNPVRAQGALVHPAVVTAEAWNVERTALDAVAAADAVLADEVDDAVGVLHDRAGCGAGLEAPWFLAVHAAVLADQPLQPRALVGLLG